MPHIIVEHSSTTSKNVKIDDLTGILHNALSEQETVKKVAIKTRSQLVENVVIGEGLNDNFVHVTVKLLKGRSEELREKMAKSLFQKSKEFLGDSSFLSIEVLEFETYVKE